MSAEAIAVQEVEALRSEITTERKRRIHAEEALYFYANPINYGHHNPNFGKVTFQNLLIGDCEDAANNKETKIAGQRARQHFAVYDK